MSTGAAQTKLSRINSPHVVNLRVTIFYVLFLIVLAISVIAAIRVGSTETSWKAVIGVLEAKIFGRNVTGLTQGDVAIIWLIRIPRVIVAAFVGAGLSVAGAIMQALFRNPLAEPGLVGAGSGAVLGSVIAFVAGWSANSVVALPLAAIIGGLLALIVVYAMATRGGVTPIATLLLAGIAVASLLSAASSLLLSINIVNWQLAQQILFWMLGGLDARTWTHVWLCAPFVLLGILSSLIQSRNLDLLQQGEETAASLGVNIEAAKRTLTLTAALLTGSAVAVAGMVGFVGLIVPHAMRLIFGPSNRYLIPASAIGGASFLVICDLIARTIHPPTEVRLGIITALCGGPFFIALLIRRSRQVNAE